MDKRMVRGPVVASSLCTGVVLVAAARAAREGAEWGIPMLALGLALPAVMALREETARRNLTALGFVFCAVLSGRFVLRFDLPFVGETSWCAAPGVMLLCVAWGIQVSARRGGESGSLSMPMSAAMCVGAGALGYLCLASIYSLETDVLRSIVLNGVLAACSWSLMMGLEPRKGLALMVCAGLLLCAGMALS